MTKNNSFRRTSRFKQTEALHEEFIPYRADSGAGPTSLWLGELQFQIKMQGTYLQGDGGGTVTLDLKSGGKAQFTMMGENMACSYQVNGDKLMLHCTPKGEKVEFTIHDDGSLTGPGFIGIMKKSK